MISNRRSVLRSVSAGFILAAPFRSAARPSKETEEDVSPAEDLMREHGLLKRVLLIYGEIIRRIDARQDFPAETLFRSAGIIRHFIEDYHEKLEEQHLFPRFRKAGKLVELVHVLEQQHKGGRILTERILHRATAASLKNTAERASLREDIRLFISMYEPHEAREDTVLFPALHQIVSRHEYDSMGEEFEKKEHQLFGEDGFEKNVAEVAGIEKTLGIYDLGQFTPRV